ncbi:MAG: phosphatidylglycerophosphatase A family protein [Culicoidibacterales bacterium]
MSFNRVDTKDIVIDLLNQRGVSIHNIADLVYFLQEKYVPNLSLETCIQYTMEVLGKREVQSAILTGIELDILAEQNKLTEPLQAIVARDEPLYGIDEILALSITNIYGSIAFTNFGYIDKVKPGILATIDAKDKDKVQCNTFLDDLVGAVAAAAASSIAHAHGDSYYKNELTENCDRNA